jgi:hypothetical protein
MFVKSNGVARVLPASLALLTLARVVHADDAPVAPLVSMLVLVPDARLIGSSGGGGGGVGRAPSGAFFGVDTGATILLGTGDAPARDAGGFGARAGYQLSSGLAFDVRFDDLGVHAPDVDGPIFVASAGVRYVLPLIVMPFVDAHVGPAFYGSHVAPAVGLGLGLAFPLGRHAAFELSARDWVADVDADVRHTAMFGGGITIGFGGRTH